MSVVDIATRAVLDKQDSFVQQTARFIYNQQLSDGGIPWEDGRHIDPWNHVEAAMGLSIGGKHEAAVEAYKWLYDRQLDNGGWWAQYKNDQACAQYIESHFVAYVATGVWHHYVITGDDDFLGLLWCTVEAALDCVVRCQHADGAVGWQVDAQGRLAEEALLAGCASIHRSLDCGIAIARVLGQDKVHWLKARRSLMLRLRNPNARFLDRSRYAMDWFYPVLSGSLSRPDMCDQLERSWDKFVVPGRGCRCVSDEPWVAVAESCELVIALQSVGEAARAMQIYRSLQRFRDEEGAYWTGYQYELGIPWPREKTTWTAAASLLAYDALHGYTPASELFLSPAAA